MKRLYQICNCSLTSTPIDLWLVRLVTWAVGIGVLVLVALILPRHASSRIELFLGLGLAGLNCLVSVMFGLLATRLQFTEVTLKMPWRSRMLECASYPTGLAILILGMWFLTTLPLTSAGSISAVLLILVLTFSTVCVGILSTLIRHDFPLAYSPSSSQTEIQR
jgi:hypothetical protein